jgi:hypothetical protein
MSLIHNPIIAIFLLAVLVLAIISILVILVFGVIVGLFLILFAGCILVLLYRKGALAAILASWENGFLGKTSSEIKALITNTIQSPIPQRRCQRKEKSSPLELDAYAWFHTVIVLAESACPAIAGIGSGFFW